MANARLGFEHHIARTVRISLAFLGDGGHQAALLRDDKANVAAVTVEAAALKRTETLGIDLREGGGFIARFSRDDGSR